LMSTEPRTLNPEPSAWPHRLAVLLCCATFPLVWVGGLVTTYKAGMAVPDWPNTYGYNLFLYPWTTWILGPWDIFVEHGHRLFASSVGMLTIALCVSLWITRQPKWLRVCGLIALAAVIFQGVLGGMRVLLDEQLLAMIHGCFGPAFFAFTAVLAFATSKGWRENHHIISSNRGLMLRRLAIATPILAYTQLALGAHLRHFAADGSPAAFHSLVIWHIMMGLTLALYVVLMAVLFWKIVRGAKSLLNPAMLLVGLLGLQLILGASTWVVRYGWPTTLLDSPDGFQFTVEARSWWQAQITTAHVATGSLILAVSTLLAVRTFRAVDSAGRQAMRPAATSKNNSLAGATA
jgi:heme a synthase